MRLQRNRCEQCVNNTSTTECPYRAQYVAATALIDEFLSDCSNKTNWFGTLNGTCDYYVENPNLASETACGNGG